ncbi:MAG: cysteine-rich small domain-containing protein [Eubacteriaceae bacterium]|nr:cysteine-rich small domain-containing protein [Eubacteriaceae bacterium]
MDRSSQQYRFFQNTACEFFPCHSLNNNSDFNCLFCYCPLYALGKSCGGNFQFDENGIKNCSACTFPHKRENYDAVLKKIKLIIKKVTQECREEKNDSTKEGTK